MRVNVLRRCALMLLVLCAVISPVVAHAAPAPEIDAVLQTLENSASIAELCDQANNSIGETILYYEAADGLLKFSNGDYAELDSKEKERFMETALKYVSSLPNYVSAKTKNSLYNFIAQQDTAVTSAMKYLQLNAGADLVEAETWFAPFNSVIGTILGIICILIFLFLGLSILFDIFYLIIPPFQALLDASGDGMKKPWGVSREAWSSMRDVEKSEMYKNVVGMYFKRRAGVIVIVSIAITYLVSGKIYDLVIWLVEAFS